MITNEDNEFQAICDDLQARKILGSACIKVGRTQVESCHPAFSDCLGKDQGGSNGLPIISLTLVGFQPGGAEAWKISWGEFNWAIYWFDKKR